MKRPAPKDIAEMRIKLGGVLNLAKHYKASTSTVSRWLIESDIPTGPPPRIGKPPSDFAEIRSRMTIKEMQDHYGVGRKAIERWTKELNLPRKKTVPPVPKIRPAPDGFTKLAPTMSINALSAHYNACGSTVKRWLTELGIGAKKPYKFRMKNRCTPIPSAKNDHPHEKAVNYLRRFMAVSPCDKDGKYKLGGRFYRVGQNVLSREETIRKAEKHMERQKTISYSNSIAS